MEHSGSLFQAIASYASKMNLILINTQALSLSPGFLSHQCDLGLSTQRTPLLARLPEASPVFRNRLRAAKGTVILLCSSRRRSVPALSMPSLGKPPCLLMQYKEKKSDSVTSPSSTPFYAHMSAFLW